MDQSFERSFVAQCAPTLAGVKPANLFRFQSKEPQMIYITAAYWNQQLSRKGIRVCVLKSFAQTQSFLIMAYRKNWIEKILCQQETRRFLKDLGYLMWEHCESFLQQLSERLCMEQEFPHEVGVFLGYPLCDVIGFMENKGKNYTFCGCWKAYGNPNEAKRRFDTYKKCTRLYKIRFAHGTPIGQLAVAI